MKTLKSHRYLVRALASAVALAALTTCFLPKAMAGDFTYITNSSTITITGYSGSGGTVTIPSNVDGVPVTGIGANVFAANAAINKVIIPAGVTNIGDGAFLNCPNLTSATVPGNVNYDSNLTGFYFFQVVFGQSPITNLTIAAGSPFITHDAFFGATHLTSITIPNSVQTIGPQAFFQCSSLGSITIPDSVSNLGYNLFGFCTNLTGATLGSGITALDSTFRDCHRLASLTIPNTVTTIGGSVFQNCYNLTNVVIPSSVTSIGSSAFSFCTNLPNIAIPNAVTTIGATAFSGCSRLTDIVIPSGVTRIEVNLFASCTGLTHITLPNAVTNIGANAFYACSSLPRVVIPAGVTRIEANTFAYCSRLANVLIPAGVTNIGNLAFWNCTSLPQITIPDSVTNLGTDVCANCSSLTNVTLSGNFPYSFVTAFGPSVLTGVTISDTSTFIKDNAFYQVPNLTRVTIPGSVTNTGYYTFSECPNLTDLTLGDGVATIGTSSFTLCPNLRNFTLPASVKTVEPLAFYGCNGLTSVTIPSTVTNLGSSVFSHCGNLTNATVGSGTTALDHTFESCVNLASITLPNSLTTIGSSAFSGCRKLTSINIPSSVTSIGGSAFIGCWGLSKVIIPKAVTTIGSSAFSGCFGLTQIYFAGNAPTPDTDLTVFNYSTSALVAYYLPGTTGWKSTFDGVPTALWNPQAVAFHASGGQFSFNLTGPNNEIIVVEACTNLANPVWVPVTTNFLANGLSAFSDPNWGAYRSRFYRCIPSTVTALTVFNSDFSWPLLPRGTFYKYNPGTDVAQTWTFVGNSGLANDLGDPNSSFGVTNAFAEQYAFLQLTGAATPGAISQPVDIIQAGNYSLSFLAAGRYPNYGNLNYRVQITPNAGGADVLIVTNSVTSGSSFTSKMHQFAIATPGRYTIKFTAVSGFGPYEDNSAFITHVALSSSP